MPYAHLEVILAIIRRGDWEEGLRLLTECIESPDLDLDMKRESLGHRAFLFKSLGRWRDAVADYEKLLNDMPDDSEAMVQLADALRMGEQYDEALRHVVAALALDPLSDQAFAVLRSCRAALTETPATSSPNREINPVLTALEGDASSTFIASINPEIGRLLYEVVRTTRPETVVETGSFIGYSSICLAQALEDNGRGHLHCFDLFGRIDNNEVNLPAYRSPLLGNVESYYDIAKGHLTQAGLMHRVTLHRGDSSAGIGKVFAGKGRSIDLAFIDGDHTIAGCTKDWLATERHLRRDGMALFHDTNEEVAHWRGPRFVLQCLSEGAGKRAPQWVNIPTHDGVGLAMVQLRYRVPKPRFKATVLELLGDRLFTSAKWKNR